MYKTSITYLWYPFVLSQTLYLFSSVKENQVDTFSLGNIHCESVEKYGIIQVLTKQLGNESMNYISIIKLEKLFFITTSDIIWYFMQSPYVWLCLYAPS